MIQQTPRRAAQYLRMSTERQDYSITYQAGAISAYAEENGCRIVREYLDEGLSGIGIEKRAGLQALLAAVVSGSADFEVILVYDVSSWGRFQNPDQAAHYEFICSEAGVRIEYCAESFANDASPSSALLKHIKRAMAAEYSRELSVKVRRAQVGLSRSGYWMGSTPPFGYRREAVTLDGRSLGLLVEGQYNAYPLAHTRLALGPVVEQETVRKAFSLYLEKDATFVSVAADLNELDLPGLYGKPWTSVRTRQLLLNALYRGDLVINKIRTDLGVSSAMPSADWQVFVGVVPAIVEPATFDAVQARWRDRQERVTAQMALADLKRVFALRGRVSHKVLLRHGRWTPRVYTSRLGDMEELYRLCGSVRPRRHEDENLKQARAARLERGGVYTEERLLERLRSLWDSEGYLTAKLIRRTAGMPDLRTYQLRFGSLALAYAAIGYQPMNRVQATQIRRSLLKTPSRDQRPSVQSEIPVEPAR